MAEGEIDLFAFDRGTVTAPAGCGKTHLIADTLKRHSGLKPILVLTHTNAGVAALRGRLDKEGVPTRAYRLMTIDGWAIRLISTFPQRSAGNLDVLQLTNPRADYPEIRKAAWKLLKAGHIQDLLEASYARLIVDEYQDCNVHQHAMIYFAAQALPSCVLGDPMQAIFGWQGNELADWDKHVCRHFPVIAELGVPWRWQNAGKKAFGEWLLGVRCKLREDEPVELTSAPREVTWIHQDRVRQLRAAQVQAPSKNGTVLIIGDSRNPRSQRLFASQIPGAIAVEAVDLSDLIQFAQILDIQGNEALESIVDFASSVMTGFSATKFLRRIEVLERGTEQRKASDAERAGMIFNAERTPEAAVVLLVELGKAAGVRIHRPTLLRACCQAFRSCDGTEGNTFYDAAIRAREQNRLLGRPLPRRAVGSTLLLKGLESEVSIILDADELDARNLYVAMTRGSHRLVICASRPTLHRRR